MGGVRKEAQGFLPGHFRQLSQGLFGRLMTELPQELGKGASKTLTENKKFNPFPKRLHLCALTLK